MSCRSRNGRASAQISRGLLDKLNGRPAPHRPFDEELEAFGLPPGHALRQAVERSQRFGSLLLKREGEEVERVREWIDEIQGEHARNASMEVPCKVERDSCTKCYKEHSEDTLACAETVRLYVQCAHRAAQELAAS